MTATPFRGRPGLLGAVLCVACSASFVLVPQAGGTQKKEHRQKANHTITFDDVRSFDWVGDEVPYIITDQERKAFNKLKTDEDREQFVEQFWERRNPNPGSLENEFKKEFYRRIVYANGHFACDVPGRKTDRGRIYIQYGPPDEIDAHPQGGSTLIVSPDERPRSAPYPYELWRYHRIQGLGENILIPFVAPVNPCDYRRTLGPSGRDPLPPRPPIPGERPSISPGPSAPTPSDAQTPRAELRLLLSNSSRPPQKVPFQVRYSFVPATEMTSLVYVTIALPTGELKFVEKDKVMHAELHIYGEITTISGRVAQVFEKTLNIDIPQNDFQNSLGHEITYDDLLPLRAGYFKLSIVAKDAASGKFGYRDMVIQVPQTRF